MRWRRPGLRRRLRWAGRWLRRARWWLRRLERRVWRLMRRGWRRSRMRRRRFRLRRRRFRLGRPGRRFGRARLGLGPSHPLRLQLRGELGCAAPRRLWLWAGRLKSLGGQSGRGRCRLRLPRGAPQDRSWRRGRYSWARPGWRVRRGTDLKEQPGSVLRMADHDGLAVMDEHRGHPRAIDVDPVATAVDGYPLPAVVMEHHGRRRGEFVRAVDPDVCSSIMADDHISTRREGVPLRPEPDNQGGSERLRRHT